MRKISLTIIILFILACRLGTSAQETTPVAEKVDLNVGSQPTPDPSAGLTLVEAWQAAEPQVRAWAADAQPSASWSCIGQLTETGRCNHWEGPMASVAKTDVAQIIITGAEKVDVRPSNSAMAGRPAISAAFSAEGIVDSPQVVQMAWHWLEEKELRQAKSRLRGLALAAGPTFAQGCGEKPHYQVGFDRPQGSICLDAYSGQVISNSFGK